MAGPVGAPARGEGRAVAGRAGVGAGGESRAPGPAGGAQVKRPAGVMLAPAGAPGSRLKVRVLAGRSGSLAVAAKGSSVSSVTVWFPMAARGGGRFTSGAVRG